MRRALDKSLLSFKERYRVTVLFTDIYPTRREKEMYKWLTAYQGLGRYHLGNGYEEDTWDDGAWSDILMDITFSRSEDAIMFKLRFGEFLK